jgi:hypothetical protein
MQSAHCSLDIPDTIETHLEGPVQQLQRIGAYAAFVLTIQFLATVAWIVISWPPTGLSGLMHAMADSFLAEAQAPFPFILANIYNASFAASAVVLAVVMRTYLTDSPFLMQLAVLAVVIAAAMFVASGVIPIVSIPQLMAANDMSAVNAVVGVATGLVLGATMASGAGVILAAVSGLQSGGRMPQLLCYLMIFDGLMQLGEFSVPLFLILDPVCGTIWSLWIGSILWREGFTVQRPLTPALT